MSTVIALAQGVGIGLLIGLTGLVGIFGAVWMAGGRDR